METLMTARLPTLTPCRRVRSGQRPPAVRPQWLQAVSVSAPLPEDPRLTAEGTARGKRTLPDQV